MAEHEGLPVHGYKPQPDAAIKVVNYNKQVEELLLRTLDGMKNNPTIDQRWLAIGRTHIEEGFMAINRSVFKPSRVTLPTDQPAELELPIAEPVPETEVKQSDIVA